MKWGSTWGGMGVAEVKGFAKRREADSIKCRRKVKENEAGMSNVVFL